MNDPQRLRDGAYGDELRLLVRAAEGDVLDDDGVARLRTRLAAVGVAASGTTLAMGKTSALRALAAKLFVVLGAGAVAIAAMSHFQPRRIVTAPQPAVTATVASTTPVPIEPASPTVAVVETISVTDLPKAPARVVAHAVKTETTIPAPPPPAATTPREGLLLLQARRALPTDPARALALVQQHETEFPQSQLAPEREKIRREAAR